MSVANQGTETTTTPVVRASDLTLEEKVRFLTGKSFWDLHDLPRLGIETITVSDGPHGIRKTAQDISLEAYPATCFPAAASSVCSWNTKILKKLGEALALEAESFGVSVVLGPAMNLKRHPAGGRNLEYFSEDPYLNGKLASAYVQGIQASGKVAACPKHFAVNNQESHRFVVDAVVDDRTLRELYLKHFEMVVKESQPALIMGAYNKLNGTYCCEHKELLTDILRTEWGYKGALVTDWTATNIRSKAIAAGLDLEMPGSAGAHNLELGEALSGGHLSEKAIDDCVNRVLNLIQTYPKPQEWSEERRSILFEKNHQVAKEVALDSIILLKNDNELLPLSPATKIAVIGEFAKKSRFQGMGSSNVIPTRVAHAYDSLQEVCDYAIPYAHGYDTNLESNAIHQPWIDEAVTAGKKADVIVLFLGLPEIMESEGFDRETLELPPQQLALLQALTLHQQKIIVVLSHGGVVLLPDTISKVSSILDTYLGGQAIGDAIADLIYGVASPSGRLPETIPLSADQIPAHDHFPGDRYRVEYREGLQVGYRFFDSNCSFGTNPSVRYPFGHGLSYSTFEYTKFHVDVLIDETKKKAVEVRFQLQNTGKMAAKEVIQCYVAPLQASVYRPDHELKYFAKIALEPGVSQTVLFTLEADSFAFYDIGSRDWVVEPGSYEIQIGSSSQNILFQREIRLETGHRPSPIARESYPSSKASSTSDADFANRFGPEKSRRVMEETNERGADQIPKKIERNSLFKEAASFSTFASIFLWIVLRAASTKVRKGPNRERDMRMLQANVESIPLRAIVLGSNGGISFFIMDALIGIMNGHWKLAVINFLTALRRWIVGHSPLASTRIAQDSEASMV